MYSDLKKSELPVSTTIARAANIYSKSLTWCPQAYWFGLFHPYRNVMIYAETFSILSPSSRMFLAAFTSLL